jgi:DNA-binding PadR family transcriptional regulator
MTEDQKAISLILELLQSSKGIPRTLAWIQTEVRLAGRQAEVPAILETMQDAKLITSERDALKIRRYTLTPAGRDALAAL